MNPTPTDQTPLTIVKLDINNVLRLRAVHLEPTGDVVTLTGRNGAGKSSVLNSIMMVLSGADAIPERPIRDGSSSGSIVCDLGDIVVERRFSASGGTTLEVKSRDGQKLRSPQAILDALFNELCDPVKFVRLSETSDGRRQQAEIFRQIVKIDFTALEASKAKHYEERKLVNRDLEMAKSALNSYPVIEGAPESEIVVAHLMEQLEEARTHNQAISKFDRETEQAEGLRDNTAIILEESDVQISDMEQKLANLKAGRNTTAATLANHNASIEQRKSSRKNMKPMEESLLRAQITSADELNGKFRHMKRRGELLAEVEMKGTASDDHTSAIESIDRDKQNQLENAQFPLPGLGLTESGVTLNGVPFSQGSQAKQLQAAVAIAMALNPRVKVILLREASLFDDESLKVVTGMARATGFQCWLEIVKSDDPTAIEISEGEVLDGEIPK